MTSSLNGIGTKPADHSTVVFQRPVFQQLALRAQWVGAADVLARAIRLTVMGYFFPSADIVPRHWVGTSFMGYRMDVVDSAETRPGEIRASLGGARGGLDCVGPDAVKTYVEVERGPLVRWNQKDVVASGKLTAELWINVVDVLASIPEAERPWGPEYTAAQKWVHERLQDAAPKVDIFNRAVVVEGLSGSFDHRYFVLPAGSALTLG